MRVLHVAAIVFSLLTTSCRCSDDDSGGSPDASTGTDTDSDGDTDTDTDSLNDTDFDAGADSGAPLAIEWIPMMGGTYIMGSEGGPYENEQPAHLVSIPPFELTCTETTIYQYAECVADGACAEPSTSDAPDTGDGCNWGVLGRGNHPVNCVDVFQAQAYCAWIGGRLPSESEWEYAARSLGQDNEYPWGGAEPSCDRAVIAIGIDGVAIGACGLGETTFPVCSRPLGNTEQDLCDMAGNTWEWVQDAWHINYNTAPNDGSAWNVPDDDSRVLRGGGYNTMSIGVRTRIRSYYPEEGRSPRNGFRCARSGTGDADGGFPDGGKSIHSIASSF